MADPTRPKQQNTDPDPSLVGGQLHRNRLNIPRQALLSNVPTNKTALPTLSKN